MVLTRRKEPFRYLLKEPESCRFQIVDINGKAVHTKLARAEFINVSKAGCRFAAKLDLRHTHNKIKLIIHIQLNEEPLQLKGTIRWQQQVGGQLFLYGMEFDPDDRMYELISRELRLLAGRNKITVV
ncbi:PilZ domain-containing protein [Paenibacillus abyssi]|uniref:PilZ domain-containing protein n=1 Tax=Paenibacillus abyssi TaxID=1340531 RepID=A0A917G507_9BACL|nr:PilZ domain-containing protein [Paenibacillus abyssi]GGG23205.1 hypothetical protein GCM10010916_44720 [Paenibacillus abyssi]